MNVGGGERRILGGGLVNVGGDYYILDIHCQQLWNVVQSGVSVHTTIC